MATTFKDLQNAVLNELHGQTADQEERCALTADMTTGALTFTVDDASQVSRGLVEIDSELLWVKTVDPVANIVTCSAFGRGYGETTTATHTSGTMVMNNPRFPRQYVRDAITDTLNEMYPEVFQVKDDESNTASAVQVTYPVPADCDFVLAIQWQTTGPSGMWTPIRRYRLDPNADATAFPTGKSVDILQPMTPGRTVKIRYVAAPGTLVNDSDTLVSTGLGEGVRDILKFGACARLLQSVEVARLQQASVMSADRDMLVNSGVATAASRAYWALHQNRLDNEANRLQQLVKPTSHMTR